MKPTKAANNTKTFMETTRQQKIARLIQKELGDMFQKQTSLTHGLLVSVSEVRVSSDLQIASVYLSVFPPERGKGIVDNVKPKLLIVIDALSSRSIERISSTIQLSDTGIVPGAGVGNTRAEISENTLGIPVIALGIPTVVESAVLVNDCLDLLIQKLQDEAKSNVFLNDLKEKDNYETIKDALNPQDYNMIVTPKEIDDLIENMKDVVARGINYAVN